MNPRDLDREVAEKLWGLVDNPDEWSKENKAWFWIHPRDGILIGEAWNIDEDNYSHSWRRFEPSTSISDTWIALEKTRESSEGESDFWIITDEGKDKGWTISSNWAHHDGAIENFSVTDENICVAICKAIMSLP